MKIKFKLFVVLITCLLIATSCGNKADVVEANEPTIDSSTSQAQESISEPSMEPEVFETFEEYLAFISEDELSLKYLTNDGRRSRANGLPIYIPQPPRGMELDFIEGGGASAFYNFVNSEKGENLIVVWGLAYGQSSLDEYVKRNNLVEIPGFSGAYVSQDILDEISSNPECAVYFIYRDYMFTVVGHYDTVLAYLEQYFPQTSTARGYSAEEKEPLAEVYILK